MGTIERGIDVADLAPTIAWCERLSSASVEALRHGARVRALEAGDTLFEAGDSSDALYVVLSGCLGVFAGDASGRLVGQAVAGETVGETGLITGRPRGTTIRALRDSEVLRVPRTAFDALARHDPEAVRTIMRLALARVGEPTPVRTSDGPRTFAILPQTSGFDEREVAERIAAELRKFGDVIVVDESAAENREPGFFAALEARFRYVVYVAPPRDCGFRALCMRQADALVFAARAGEPAAPWSEVARRTRAPMPRPEHVLLLHAERLRTGVATPWLEARSGARLHHVAEPAHVGRFARLLVGKSTTLVLSGGGARGFAHIGVARALREHGVAIDAVGGTSIGAVVGAAIAADWSIEEMTDVYRRAFVTTNPLSDYTLPLVSMVSGRKVSRLLLHAFGDRAIEDLSLPYFCVSSNLTEGSAAVHRAGPLSRWLRASFSIPGMLPPVLFGGHVYCDGSVINNLPVDVMRASHGGEVIAVDIGGDDAVRSGVDEIALPSWWRTLKDRFSARHRPGIFEILFRASMVASGAQTLAARRDSSLLLTPPIGDVGMLEWRAFDRAIELGYRYACEALEHATLAGSRIVTPKPT